MNNLLQYPFSLRRYYQGLNEVATPPGAMGQRRWVIARGLCLYKIFTLGDVSRNERRDLLNVRILQWSPFSMTGRYVIWHEETAQVWIWDEATRLAAMQEVGVAAAAALPETLLYPRPEHDIARVIGCREGFEGQIWTNGTLVASQWWRQAPQPYEWLRFLLGNDVTPETGTSETQTFEWLAKPWGKRTGGFAILDVRREQFWLTAAVVFFSFLFTWQAVAIERWDSGVASLQSVYDQRMEDARPTRIARTRATKFKDESKQLDALVSYPSPLKLMALVTQRLSAHKAYVIEWRYSKTSLSFIVEGVNLDPLYYIDVFQRIPNFKDVTAELDKNGKRLFVNLNITTLAVTF